MASPASADPLLPNLVNAGYKIPPNPYSDPTQCTFFAWGRAYEKHGINMPKYGNAVNWYTATSYPKSSTRRADSIAVWAGGPALKACNYKGCGHVAYVEKVENGYVFFNEANFNTYKSGGGYDGNYKKLTPTQMKSRSGGTYTL